MEGTDPAPSRAELSKTPSWIMVGFILGVLAVWGFRRDDPAPPPAAAAPEVKATPAPAEPAKSVTSLENRPSLAVIEAVFAQWGDYALWEDDRTEVALWNSVTADFTDFIEVSRMAGVYYFRSIPRLTRPFTDAKPPRESPLRFTEPIAQRRARLEGRLSPQAPAPTGPTGPWKGPAPAVSPSVEIMPLTPPPPERPQL